MKPHEADTHDGSLLPTSRNRGNTVRLMIDSTITLCSFEGGGGIKRGETQTNEKSSGITRRSCCKALRSRSAVERSEHYPGCLARPEPKVEPVVEKVRRRGRLDLAPEHTPTPPHNTHTHTHTHTGQAVLWQTQPDLCVCVCACVCMHSCCAHLYTSMIPVFSFFSPLVSPDQNS